MKKKNSKTILVALGTLATFALWTFLIRCVDVQPIGPNGSRVGFAAINGAFHALTGVHWALYTLTDWLGLVPIGIALGFAVLGLVQLIRRKSLLKVDRDILILGGFYIVVLAAYLLFETVVINFRPRGSLISAKSVPILYTPQILTIRARRIDAEPIIREPTGSTGYRPSFLFFSSVSFQLVRAHAQIYVPL